MCYVCRNFDHLIAIARLNRDPQREAEAKRMREKHWQNDHKGEFPFGETGRDYVIWLNGVRWVVR